MGVWSGGGINISGSIPSSTYTATYPTPTYSSPPPNTVVTGGPYIVNGGQATVSCQSSVFVGWEVELYNIVTHAYTYESKSYSTTAPACPVTPPPPDTSGRMNVYNGSSWVKGITYVFNGTSWVQGTVYVYNGSAWVKSV